MPKLLELPYSKYYNANVCSISFLVFLITVILAVLCSVYIVIYTGNAWKPVMEYYEQPIVKHYDHLFLAVNFEGNEEKFFSTNLNFIKNYEENNVNLDIIPIIKYSEFDDNFDGIPDRHKFYINFYRKSEVKSLKIYLFFEYSLIANVQGSFESLAKIEVKTPSGASFIKIDGVLNFVQKSPLNANSLLYEDKINPLNETSIKNKSVPVNLDELDLIFRSRNFSTDFDYDTFTMPKKSSEVTQIEITVTVPSFQKILYQVPQFTKLKFFFIQFLSILIPVGYIFYVVLYYLYQNNIFETVKTSDLELNKI